jgi:predicted ATP-dependent protease
LISDFTLIRPGSLHRANGGYLIVDLRKILAYPHAWESLKRALFSRELRIESLPQVLGLSTTTTLEPAPIPLDVKVVAIGDRLLHHLLSELDPDVGELFRIVAEFDDRVDRTAEAELGFARHAATIGRARSLKPLDRQALAGVLDHASRLAGDSRKLSTSWRDIETLLVEADHWASDRGADRIEAPDVKRAIEMRVRRRDLVQRRVQESILSGTLLVDTSGEQIGQVNGLSVVEIGGIPFGWPTRITATARVGDGKLVDIEREVELGGALHSKGVLILSSYFAGRYTRQIPLSLTASLVFEQSYGGVEGDSASLAELCALLSSLSQAPVRQSLAVTGSVNQHGQVQAIGAVNDKIEGFFEICRARGLDGKQGVIIPSSNLPHLMLAEEVVQACAAGQFNVWAVDTADDAIEILTGVPAGAVNEEGEFPDDSLNARVLETLLAFAVVAEGFSKFVEVKTGSEAAAADQPNSRS